MRFYKIFYVVLLVSIVSFIVSCGTTGPMYTLKSSRTQEIMGKTINLPYANVVRYFGYVSPSITPDGKVKGKDAYYLYMWVPAAVDEIGVAMYSPADIKPGKDDFVHPAFEKGMAENPKAYFDTYLVLDRLVILDAAKIKDGAKAQVFNLAENDDSSEIPANPGGHKYNSLIRVKTDTANIQKALVRSVYRIAFTSFRGNVTGSYLVQVGTNVPGVKIAPSLEQLHKLVNETK